MQYRSSELVKLYRSYSVASKRFKRWYYNWGFREPRRVSRCPWELGSPFTKELYNHLVISLNYNITYELVMIISCFLPVSHFSSRFSFNLSENQLINYSKRKMGIRKLSLLRLIEMTHTPFFPIKFRFVHYHDCRIRLRHIQTNSTKH